MSITAQENKQSAKANKKTLNDEIITEPNNEDILCGKIKLAVSWPGSVKFRSTIDRYASKYQSAITKNEKMAVTKEIYDLLGSQNSRFLKFNASADGWEQLSSLLARDKISHALRFANREKKSPSTSKPLSKKGHRRNGSDNSASTLSTAATELSADDFDFLLDDEPLDWNAEPSDPIDVETRPYAYPIYESTLAPAAYHGHPYPPPYYSQPHTYGHGYYHPQPYHHGAYHHYAYPAAPAPHAQDHSYEEPRPESFPEKPLPQPPVRDSSMDVDLSYLVSEPLMDWELEPEQVGIANEQ